MISPEYIQSTKAFCFQNRVPDPINVTFTQKQVVDGQWIDDLVSEQNFRHFRNLLNKRVFGNSFQRHGKQLSMLVVRENDAVHRHHLHTIIQQPEGLSTPEFELEISKYWMRTRFGHREIHFEKPGNRERTDGWVSYSLKMRTKEDFASAVDWNNSTCFELR